MKITKNKTNLWFKAKNYGWGWVPITWQGWLTTAVFIGILLLNAAYFERGTAQSSEPSAEGLSLFLAISFSYIIALLFICFKKGEKPQWRWGNPNKKSH